MLYSIFCLLFSLWMCFLIFKVTDVTARRFQNSESEFPEDLRAAEFDPLIDMFKHDNTQDYKSRKVRIERKQFSGSIVKTHHFDSNQSSVTPIFIKFGKTTTKKKRITSQNIRLHRLHMRAKDMAYRSTRLTPMHLMQQEETTSPITMISYDAGTNKEHFILSTYSLIEQISQLLSNFTNANTTYEILGRTASYNDIVLFKISQLKGTDDTYFRAGDSKYIDDVPAKKIVFIVHALSVMGIDCLYSLTIDVLLKKLLSFYLEHLDKFDIYLIPMANPDGYSFVRRAYKGKIYWNKNLSLGAACFGVALDRNFDVAWNTTRKVTSCSQQYPGTSPFSEPESRAVRDVFHRYSHKIIAYFHVHGGSYGTNTFKGDAVLYPKGYTEVQSDDDKYLDIRGEIDEAMKNASFKIMSVTVDTLHNWYGKISGSSVDYASTVYGIPYAMELSMQVYMDLMDSFAANMEESIQYYALTEIWGRVINVIFSNIYKNSVVNDDMPQR